MFEIFEQRDIEEIIEVNKLISSYNNEPHEVKREILDAIFHKVNSFNDINNTRERIIKKSTYILAGISYLQPFKNCNRRTSYYLLKNFLGRNGFTLRLYNKKEKAKLADILQRTAEVKFEDDPTIYSEIEEYLTQKVEDWKFDYL
ncbi:MAG: Fic family protein [Nitrosopumilus sp.]|nr:Fic family protein [Nitrosopumilus sp.]